MSILLFLLCLFAGIPAFANANGELAQTTAEENSPASTAAETADKAAGDENMGDDDAVNEKAAVESKSEVSAESGRFALHAGVLYSTAHDFETKGDTATSDTDFEGEIESEPAFGVSFGFNYRKAPASSWFIDGGLFIELPREIERETIEGAVVDTGTTSQSKLVYAAIYGNFAYEVSSPFYLIAGLGFSGLAITNYDPKFETGSGVLLQAGAGVHFADERFYFELLGRYQGNIAERGGTADSVRYENIGSTGIVAHLKVRIF